MAPPVVQTPPCPHCGSSDTQADGNNRGVFWCDDCGKNSRDPVQPAAQPLTPNIGPITLDRPPDLDELAAAMKGGTAALPAPRPVKEAELALAAIIRLHKCAEDFGGWRIFSELVRKVDALRNG